MKSRSSEFMVLQELYRLGSVSEYYSLGDGTGLSKAALKGALTKLAKMGLVGTRTTSRGLKTHGLTTLGYRYFERMTGGGV